MTTTTGAEEATTDHQDDYDDLLSSYQVEKDDRAKSKSSKNESDDNDDEIYDGDMIIANLSGGENIENEALGTDPLYIDESQKFQQVLIPGLIKRKVTGRPRDGMQTCEICGFQAKHRYLLRNHMDIHDDKPKYKCQWDGCEKTYKQKKHLLEHERKNKHR